MTFVTVGSESIKELSASQQAEMMEHELVRIDREVALGAVINQRREAMAGTGDPYDTAFDHLMWDIVGNPYEPIGHKRWEQGSDSIWRQYGYNLFTGISDDGEILSVTGTTDGRHMHDRQGYRVHTLHIAKNQVCDWAVEDVELDLPGGTQDISLWIGRAVMDGAVDSPDIRVTFRVPSRSDASIMESGSRTYYNRMSMKNLYAVVKAFDAKYRHLDELYSPPAEVIALNALRNRPTEPAPIQAVEMIDAA